MCKTDSSKESFLQSILKNSYLTVYQKVDLCLNAKHLTCKDDKYIPIEFVEYISFLLCIINAYTNINISVNDIVGDYDKLKQNGLIQMVLGLIPEEEITELNMIADSIESECVNGIENKTKSQCANKYEFCQLGATST